MDRIDLDNWTAKEVARLLTLVENDRRYYQEILTTLPMPVAVVTRDLGIVMVNRAFRLRFHLKHADLADKRLDDMIAAAVVKERVPRVLDENEPENDILIAVPDAEGVSQACRLGIIPLWDIYGERPSEALVVMVEAESATSPSAKILEELGAVAWKADARTGDLEFSNRGVTRLLAGASPANWANRVHPEDASRVAWVYEAALDTGAPAFVDYRAVRADGTTAWFTDRIQPLTEDGKVIALHVLTSVENARRQRMERLVQTREMEAAMRLAQQVAHDFNNLWMIVNGYTEVVAERIGTTDDESRSGLDAIQKAAERGIATTSQLLSFGRPSSVHSQPLDLNEWIEELELGVELRLSEGAAPVSVDTAKLEHALRALLEFAAQRLSGGAHLHLTTGREALISDAADGLPRGQFVTLRLGPVEKAGARLLAHWCEPYFSEAGKTAPIGLAPVYSQLRQMGVWVRMEQTMEEQGEFTLDFPMVRLPEPVKKPGSDSAPAVSAETPPTPKLETVLVVDDEESIRSLVSRVLSRQGYEVLLAATPEEAIRISDGHPGPIALVVSDVLLPGMRGPEMVVQMRHNRSGLRVLYISGYTDDPQLAEGVLPAGEGFLQKPFTLQSLSDTVRAVLDAPAD